ncbi:LarC family nickel insertion protein [Desulfobacula sp.]|uniref:LarC family nickel insertion protein n=1 Tax=Desulfobacula sp. TaxID=2593537 RepID=UPI0025B7D8C4|nr:LarC family nickel insertion protein [Desulfobacula sp.]
MAILKGIPVKPSDAATEIVTPTGAAIITTLASSFGRVPEMVIQKVGYGSGKRDTGSTLPNLLRIILGEEIRDQKKRGTAIQKEAIHVVKTNVDDMNPEISGFLMETLFENKALDVCYIPVQMKKNRPGIQIEVMCRKEDLDNIVHIILTQTTSIGVRYHECERSFLLREKAFVKTSFGKLQVKKITNPDNTVRFIPEYDVAKRIAIEKRIALKDVCNQIIADANPRIQSTGPNPLDRD